LRVDSLRKKYGAVAAVDGVSFCRPAGGDSVGLLGPNGAGKTTTINMVMGVLEPDSGIRSSVEGEAIAVDATKLKALARMNFAAGYAPLPGKLDRLSKPAGVSHCSTAWLNAHERISTPSLRSIQPSEIPERQMRNALVR
jgi:energy-coupling factor transporter ATP-binding protein EcfA2